MAFLNSKEQVMDLQLTSYGKYLLSLGKFNPVSYAFFDDDIIYDRKCVSGSAEELQNDIEGRIQENTPRMSAQTIYRAAQVGVFSENSQHVNNLMPGVVAASDKKDADFLLETPESSYIFMKPLGNCEYNSNNIAAWDIAFYKAPLLNYSGSWTDTNQKIPTTFIPQLNCEINFEMYFFPKDPKASKEEEVPGKLLEIQKEYYGQEIENNDGTRMPIVLYDDSYMLYTDDFVFLKIEEANTEFLKENFELEVYKIISEATTKNPEVVERLYFASDDGVIDEKIIEYYLDIEVDFDIDETEFCLLLNHQQDKVSNIYTDHIFNCSDAISELQSLNIYDTGENDDIKEICD